MRMNSLWKLCALFVVLSCSNKGGKNPDAPINTSANDERTCIDKGRVWSNGKCLASEDEAKAACEHLKPAGHWLSDLKKCATALEKEEHDCTVVAKHVWIPQSKKKCQSPSEVRENDCKLAGNVWSHHGCTSQIVFEEKNCADVKGHWTPQHPTKNCLTELEKIEWDCKRANDIWENDLCVSRQVRDKEDCLKGGTKFWIETDDGHKCMTDQQRRQLKCTPPDRLVMDFLRGEKEDQCLSPDEFAKRDCHAKGKILKDGTCISKKEAECTNPLRWYPEAKSDNKCVTQEQYNCESQDGRWNLELTPSSCTPAAEVCREKGSFWYYAGPEDKCQDAQQNCGKLIKKYPEQFQWDKEIALKNSKEPLKGCINKKETCEATTGSRWENNFCVSAVSITLPNTRMGVVKVNLGSKIQEESCGSYSIKLTKDTTGKIIDPKNIDIQCYISKYKTQLIFKAPEGGWKPQSIYELQLQESYTRKNNDKIDPASYKLEFYNLKTNKYTY